MVRLRSKRWAGAGLLVVLAAASAIARPEVPAQAATGSEVRSYNDRLLEVFGRLVALPEDAAAKTSIRSQASVVLRERAKALASWIRENPSQALSLAFSEDLRSRLRNAFPDSAQMLETAGVWEGPVETLVEDGPDFKTHRTYH